jgi:DNA modification methylase
LKGWTNKLIWGDNKLILSALKNGPLRDEIEAQGGLKLIYIDPPFDVGADFSFRIDVGDEILTKRPSVIEELAYRDTWGRGSDSFIAMMYERLQLIYGLLSDEGTLYIHCDWHVGHYIKAICLEIFGPSNFVNEITWHYYNKMAPISACFPRASDRILSFAKNFGKHTFHQQYEKRDKPVKQLKRQFIGGKAINVRDASGVVQYQMKDDRRLDDVWRVSMLQPADKTEYLAYGTQKPETILRRIIEASSNPGDLVGDFFSGSGTTVAVAEKLGRKWIGSDLGKFAIHTTRKRLIGVQRELKSAGNDYRAFEILNLGKYERQHYVGVNPNLREAEQEAQLAQKEAEFLALILRAYGAEKTDGFATFHGKKAGRLVSVGPVNLPVTRLYVEEVISECRQKRITRVDILGFEFEMGLFPNVLDEARAKGIDIAPKYIPAEVFDKRAVEKNQVRFHDVSYIEVKSHVGKSENGLPTVAVELTDFSVYYSQGSIRQSEATLKPGGSAVVVEKGQIVKVSKSKSDVVTREVLTKKWSDWIDYWAVDFDFENKKEIIRKPIVPDDRLPGIEAEQRTLEAYEEVWTGDYIFENEWQTFRTKKDRSLELKSVAKECVPGRRKIAVKVVDIFGNDTMTIVEVSLEGKKGTR